MPSVTFTNTYSVSYWGSVTASVRVTFSESYNQNTNQTTLTLTDLEFKKNGSSNVGDIPVYGVLSVNGTTVCTIDNSGSGKKSSVNMDGDGWRSASLTNVTKTPVVVTHNADGTKNVSVSVAPGTNSRFCAQYAWYHQTGTDPQTGHAIYRTTYVPFGVTADTATMTLTTRPRISSVTATNANFGSAVTITLNRYNSAFTHTVKASCAGRTETVMTKGTTYPTVTWTPSVANFAPLITNAMSATATITCETYNGNTLIGTSTTTCKLTFTSASVKPSVSIATADPTGLLSTYGKYVVGKSKVKVTLTNTLKYGATVTAIAITANGASYNSSPATTDFIASTSNTSVTAKITDSRGQTATASATIQIYGYTAPKINSASVYRCDSGGTANNAGAYFRVAYNVAITDLGNHNTKTLTVKYKKRSASSYSSSSITMSSYSQSGNSSAIAADVNSTYDVQLVLADAFGSATVTKSLPTEETRMNFGTGQNGGVAIGKVSEYNKTFEVEQSWTVRTGNIISEKAGNAIIKAYNNLTGVSLNLDTGAGVNHGIYTYGYYDGSSFHSDGKWMIYRNSAGYVFVDGTKFLNRPDIGYTTGESMLDKIQRAITNGVFPTDNTPFFGSIKSASTFSVYGHLYTSSSKLYGSVHMTSINGNDVAYVCAGDVWSLVTPEGAAPAPAIVDKSTTSTSTSAITAEYTVSGSGTVIVYAGIYSDTTSDYGTWEAEIYYDGTLIMGEGTRFTTANTQKYGASTSVPVAVTNGKKIKITLFCSKGGTKNIFRRFLCFGCTVS
ncbi:MAG: hypothetical protein IKG25_04205 [Mogibacterium sp.]|nr:hypothetical protein [Mogibacterium sp.]